MRRLFPAVLLFATLATAVPAQAQWMGKSTSKSSCPSWWERTCATWRLNRSWPAPFIAADREAVNAPLVAQAQKGWQRQNLLGAFHFDPQTNQLTRAGELKVREILTQSLPDRRTIFVERALSNQLTAARVDAVQQTAVRMLPAGELPEVAESNLVLDGWPAADVDATMNAFEKTRPDPRIPAISAEGATGGESP
jgi:hypothetical protein